MADRTAITYYVGQDSGRLHDYVATITRNQTEHQQLFVGQA